MLRPCVIAGIAALFAAGTLWAQSDPVRDDAGGQPATTQRNQSASQDTQIATALRRIAGALETQNGRPEPQAEQQRAADDLDAQRRMAKWAKWMFWAAATQAVLSGIGIVLIYITFQQTRRAADAADGMVKESEKATRAAIAAAEAGRDANKIAMETAKAIDRAWLRPTLKLRGPLIIENGEISAVADVVVKNVGKAPATHVKIRTFMYADELKAIRDVEGRDFPIFMKMPLAFSPAGDILFPGDDARCTHDRAVLLNDIKGYIEYYNSVPFEGLEPKSRAMPVIMIAVQYALPGDTQIRWSCVAFQLLAPGAYRDGFTGDEIDGAIHGVEVSSTRLASYMS